MAIWIIDTDNIYGKFMESIESNTIDIRRDEVVLIKGYNDLNGDRVNNLINRELVSKLSVINKYFGKNSTDFIIVIEVMKCLSNGDNVIIVTDDKILQEACKYITKSIKTGKLRVSDMKENIKNTKKMIKTETIIDKEKTNNEFYSKLDELNGDILIKENLKVYIRNKRTIDLSKIYTFLNNNYKSNGITFYSKNKKQLREICKNII